MTTHSAGSEHTPNIRGAERRGWVWSLALCVCVWFISTLFLRGDLGRWNDDYLFHHIDPATGAPLAQWRAHTLPFAPPEAGVPYWRPLFFTLAPALNTVWWSTPARVHIFQAFLHLVVCGVFYWTSRGLGVSRRGSVSGVLMIAACAPAFEVVMWAMAWPTLLGTALMLASVGLLARGMRGSAWAMAGCVLAALPVPLLNEQPAGCFLALPAVALAVRRPGESAWQSLRRAAWPIAAVAAWCVGYAALLVTHPLQGGGVGGAGHMIPLLHVGSATGKTFSWLWRELFEWHFIRSSAMPLGWAQVRAGGAWSAVVLGVTAVCAGAGLLWLASPRGESEEPKAGGNAGVSTRGIVLIAVAIGVGSLVPLIAVGAPVRPRMTLLPWIEIALLTGVGVDAARRAVVSRGLRLWPWSAVGTAALVWLVASSSLAMVGAQAGYRARWRLDAKIAEQFRAEMPDPPEGTVFFVLGANDWPVQTGNPNFDYYFVGPLAPSWAYPTFLRHVYGRNDVECVTKHWEKPGVLAADRVSFVPEEGISYDARTDPPPAGTQDTGVRAFSWERVVPVETLRDGTVVVIDRLEVEQKDGGVLSVTPPRARLWRGVDRRDVLRLRVR